MYSGKDYFNQITERKRRKKKLVAWFLSFMISIVLTLILGWFLIVYYLELSNHIRFLCGAGLIVCIAVAFVSLCRFYFLWIKEVFE